MGWKDSLKQGLTDSGLLGVCRDGFYSDDNQYDSSHLWEHPAATDSELIANVERNSLSVGFWKTQRRCHACAAKIIESE